eukprot:TRINITY_DN1248_c0_g1_i1.p1 TRINITY_DN1248_c0_g1~~TRINITY_DN1248_c0_g1_i1.p1  ORF type:complete len:234 (+),score=54.39 TRINITY_DN1248_c0_g1_i1:746-1447(+)
MKKLNDYRAFIASAGSLLKRLQKALEVAKSSKISKWGTYCTVPIKLAAVCNKLEDYEKNYVFEYANRQEPKLLLSRSDSKQYTEAWANIEKDVTKPFDEILVWTRQTELLFEAYEETIKTLAAVAGERNKAEAQRERAEELATSSKTKNHSQDKTALAENELLKWTKEAEQRTQYLNIAIVYMSELFLPAFQRRQLQSFYELFKELIFTDFSIMSALYETWSHFANDSVVKDF